MNNDTRYLTSIRGLACLMVLVAHVLANIPGVGYNVSGCGKIGVWLFFILSSFLLTIQWLNKEKMTKREVIKFYIKRIFRIFPCYIATLVIAFIVGYRMSIKTVIKHVFLLEGIGHFWTIPVEFIFYIFVPMIMFVPLKLKDTKKSILFLIVIFSISALLSPYWKCPENSIQIRWYLPVFIMGMITAYIYQYFENKSKKHVIWDIIIGGILIGMIMVIPYMRKLIFRIEPDNYLQNKYLYLGLAWCIIIIAIQNSKYMIHYLNKSKILLWIGNISFPLYLIHFIVINKMNLENTLLNSILIVVISIVFAVIMHQLLEVPTIKLSKKIIKEKEKRREKWENSKELIHQ